MIFLIVVLFLTLLLLGGYVAFVIECFLNRRPDRIIYHGSDLTEQGRLLSKIMKKYVPDTSTYFFIEPGAGLGKVAEYMGREFPWKEVIAIEIGPVILFLARLRAWLRRSQVQFIREDIFTFTFPQPAVVYCYLTTPLLDKLYAQQKLQGRLVISLTFPLSVVEPTETISVKGWQKQILVYDLR
jgi:hypothetical protein